LSPYSYARRLHWSECDPGGIVFFPNYAKWAVDGLNEMFHAAGYAPNGTTADGKTEGLPCVEFGMRFFDAPKLHVLITHEIAVMRIGTTSFTVRHRFLGEDCIYAELTDTRVWASHEGQSLRKCPLPQSVIELLKARTVQE
jgi:4-hydroxybenzoyl-CoA thioesterase